MTVPRRIRASRLWIAIWTATVILTLAACAADPGAGGGDGGDQDPTSTAQGDGDGDEQPTEPPQGDGGGGGRIEDACELLTLAEVQEAADMVATGLTVREGEGTADEDGAVCNYVIDSPDAEFAGSALVRVRWDDPRGIFNQLKNAFEGEDVSGLGDEAYWASEVSELLVLRGDYLLEVQLVVSEEETTLDAVRLLAERVLTRI